MKLSIREIDVGDCFFTGLKILALGTALTFLSHHLANQLPSAGKIHESILLEPLQTESKDPEQTLLVNNVIYQMKPKAKYLIRGLVVSLHDSSSWMDMTHLKGKDFLNTHDLCLVWGSNSISPYMSDINFSHGDWTCYFQTNSEQAWKSFRKDQISNNHILPANKDIENIIASARVGDQIELEGQLVDYNVSFNSQFRKSSMVRDDIEDGACEIIYTTGAKILTRGSDFWYAITKISQGIAAFGILIMLFALLVLPHLKPQQTTA